MRDNLGYKAKKREEELYSFIYKYKPNFKKEVQWKLVRTALNRANNPKNKLHEKFHIEIFQCEINYIKELPLAVRVKQLLFTLLIRYKRSVLFCLQTKTEKNNYKINIRNSIREIQKESALSLSKDEFYKNLQILEDNNLIINERLVYVDCIFIKNIDYTQKEIAYIIEDETLISDYWKLANGSKYLSVCSVCGKEFIRSKAGTNTKNYCKECYNNLLRAKTAERMKKTRLAKKNREN